MALLGKIRSQFGWLMIVMVILGVGGFLLMDATSYANRGNTKIIVGRVNGKKITPEMIDGNMSKDERMIAAQQRDNAWQQTVFELLFAQQTAALGLDVSEKEMGELFLGDPFTTMSQRVFREFNGDQQTGQIDKSQIRATLEAIDNPEMLGPNVTPEQVAEFRNRIEKLKRDVKNDRLSQKYAAMLQQGAYTPTWLANTEHNRQNQLFDLQFVRIPYSAIPNDQANVSDEELKKYIQDNPGKFKREASASIEFVAFDVRPSAKDSADYLKEMTDAAAQLATITSSTEDSMFFNSNDGKLPFTYLSKDDFTESPELKDSIFNGNKGALYGPYIHENAYKVVKIMDSKELADSVRYRRILYPVGQDQASQQAAFKFLDSLKTLIQTGKASFDSLAATHSVDPVSKGKGGDMGFVDRGQQVARETKMNDYMFYQAEKDSLYILGTMSGEIQLVQVTDYKLSGKKGLRIGFITKAIIPSEATTQQIKQNAIDFATKNRTLAQFQEAAKQQGLRIATASGLEINGYRIEGIGISAAAAAIISWAHNLAKDGEVAANVYDLPNDEFIKDYTRQFICPALVKKSPKGLATLDDAAVRQEVDKIVRNKKKAEVAKAALGNVASLDAVVAKYPSAQMEVSKGLPYNRPVFGTNVEPKVAAVADLLQPNQISAPIAGENAIYVLSVQTKTPAPALPDPKFAKQDATQRAGQAILASIFPALKDKATIEDNRGSVYINE